MKQETHLRSHLKIARGLGSAKHGVGHWWYQRLTAVALAPLCMWFVASLLIVAQSPDPFRMADWLASPFSAVLMAAFIVALFWHAKLGLQVVIEDYIKHPVAKYTLLLGNNFFCIGAAIVSLLAVLKLHLLDIVSGF